MKLLGNICERVVCEGTRLSMACLTWSHHHARPRKFHGC
jgi:hypothetical protein